MLNLGLLRVVMLYKRILLYDCFLTFVLLDAGWAKVAARTSQRAFDYILYVVTIPDTKNDSLAVFSFDPGIGVSPLRFPRGPYLTPGFYPKGQIF